MKTEIGRLSTVRESKVNKMELVKQEKFAGLDVEFYRNENNEVFMTRNQIGQALGYAQVQRAMNKIHERNKERLDKFSVVVKLGTTDGKAYDTTVYSEKGIYEILRKSNQPKADDFYDFVYEVIEGLRKGELQVTQKASYEIDDPIERAKRWIEEEEKRQQLQIENEEMKPKALFSDAVSASETSILIGSLAKLIKQNGINIGQNRLYEWLRQNGYLVKRRGNMYNSPTQRSMDMGLFETKMRTIVNPDDTVRTTRTTMVTGKGQIYFINKFIGSGTNE